MIPKARVAAPLIALVLAAACASGPREIVVAREARTRSLASPSCGGCHETELVGWEASMHHASFSNADFQASHREEPSAFCVDCHAPRGRELGTPEAYAHGIGCESCHPASAQHAQRPATAAATTSSCTTCHDFDSERAPSALQSTEQEHRASRYRDTPCIDCHMETSGPRGRDHRFVVSRNAELLARALFVGDARRRPDHVTFVLRSVAVGHRFPTGDIFRRLHVRAWIEDAQGRVLGDQDFDLNRDWEAHRAARSGAGRPVERGDTRLDDTPRELRLPLPSGLGPSPLRLRVRVDYQRGFEARAGRLDLFSTLRIAERDFDL